jgi:hypothetical protein
MGLFLSTNAIGGNWEGEMGMSLKEDLAATQYAIW